MGENYSTKMYDSRFLRVNNYYIIISPLVSGMEN